MPVGIYKRKPFTAEHKRKLSMTHKGIKFSEERKARMNKDKLGKKRPPRSEEWKRKLGLANKGKKRSKEYCEKYSKARMGHIVSQETKDKISKAHFKTGSPWNIGRFVGSKGYFWKGGITPVRTQICNCFKYRQWISDIFERDNYICQECFKRGNRLSAHHIKAFALILRENNIKTLEDALNCEELWNLNNGQTLCFPCHRKTPNYARNLLKPIDLLIPMV